MFKIFRPKDIIYLSCPLEYAYITENLEKISEKTYEEVCVIMLDSKYRLIELCVVNTGSQYKCRVNNREIFERADAIGACNICIVHNHPSSALDVRPSETDIRYIETLEVLSKEWCVNIIDSIIISDNLSCYCLSEKSVFSLNQELNNYVKRIYANYSECKNHIPDFIEIDREPKTLIGKIRKAWGTYNPIMEVQKPIKFTSEAKVYRSVGINKSLKKKL